MSSNHSAPLFLIGTHRSGTTWTGNLLSQSDELAYWVEPRQVWSYGNYRKPDDVLDVKDATPKIKSHIQYRFKNYAKRHGKTRFCEKTPSNCLRIPFINEVFPSGLFILIIRDGRAVYRSTEEIKKKSADWNRIWDRIRESSWKEIPAFYDRVPWLMRKLIKKPLNFWGVRPPGWRDWLSHYSPDEIIALQWSHTIRMAFDHFHELPEPRRLLVRFEDLLEDPQQQMERIGEFAGLEDASKLVQTALATVNRKSNVKWKEELSPEVLERVRPILQPTLEKLGYEW